MFDLKDPANVRPIHELTDRGIQLNCVLIEITDILFISHNLGYLLTSTKLSSVINICM